MNKYCSHYSWVIREEDAMGMVYCKQCEDLVPLEQALHPETPESGLDLQELAREIRQLKQILLYLPGMIRWGTR